MRNHNQLPSKYDSSAEQIFHLDYGLALATTFMEGDVVHKLLRAVRLAVHEGKLDSFISLEDPIPNQTMNLATLLCHIGRVPTNVLEFSAPGGDASPFFWVRFGHSAFWHKRTCLAITAPANGQNRRAHTTLHFINRDGAVSPIHSPKKFAEIFADYGVNGDFSPLQTMVLQLASDAGHLNLDLSTLRKERALSA